MEQLSATKNQLNTRQPWLYSRSQNKSVFCTLYAPQPASECAFFQDACLRSALFYRHSLARPVDQCNYTHWSLVFKKV